MVYYEKENSFFLVALINYLPPTQFVNECQQPLGGSSVVRRSSLSPALLSFSYTKTNPSIINSYAEYIILKIMLKIKFVSQKN